ncbi:MAG: hypothetical protein CMN58_05465 [Solibacterales bacterium]|nr:hypothetical protein [Bryobacterales bacterium]|tara:strand:- start:3694 stop:4260 length:567 start_codon:yes stop_codon:yes gene_type:complete
MQFELNMATRPFQRRRLASMLIGVATLTLTVVTALIVATYILHRELPIGLAKHQSQLRAELADLSADEAKLRKILQDSENDVVFERSMFLNRLLQRKGISWTRTFFDLESILPSRVQVIQIRPEVTASNDIALSMQVGAEAPSDFIEFLKALEGSNLFESPNLRGSVPPSDNQPLFRYQLTVRYDQQL